MWDSVKPKSISNGSELKLIESPPIVKIENLYKRFGSVNALSELSLEVPAGRIVGLLGPNGSGKTTLIKILAGFYTFKEGQVLISGRPPSHITKSIVSYQPDRGSFPTHMTVNDIVSIYKRYFDNFNESHCLEMLDAFQIKEYDTTNQMSKGMIDKLQICLTMSRKAKLYLLDEPIGGVDTIARDLVIETILNSFNPLGTIIVATHSISQVEHLFDTAIVLSKGHLICYDDCDAIRQRYGVSLEEALIQVYSVKC